MARRERPGSRSRRRPAIGAGRSSRALRPSAEASREAGAPSGGAAASPGALSPATVFSPGSAEALARVRRFAEEELGHEVVEVRLVRAYSVLDRDAALYEARTGDGSPAEVILAHDGTLTIFTQA